LCTLWLDFCNLERSDMREENSSCSLVWAIPHPKREVNISSTHHAASIAGYHVEVLGVGQCDSSPLETECVFIDIKEPKMFLSLTG
jgi:hypothetical protein